MCEHCRKEEKFKESLEELKDVKGFNKIMKPFLGRGQTLWRPKGRNFID